MPSAELYYQEWGAGDPVIALPPLSLESTAFAGMAELFAERGLRTLAVDPPGFGRSPAPAEPLTPARLAVPVIELARGLERPPLLLGLSLGARVALEAALLEPASFRGVVAAVPFLPWRRFRGALALVRWLDPRMAERLPLEKAWPLLKRLAHLLEHREDLEHDWLGRAAVRVVYYSSCPATRAALLSASREMALDPPFGPEGFWTRLAGIRVPVSFVWAGRDALIPRSHVEHVGRVLPGADQVEVPCAGHFVSAGHFGCMSHALALAAERTLAAADAGREPGAGQGMLRLAPCRVGAIEPDAAAPAAAPESAARLRTETS